MNVSFFKKLSLYRQYKKAIRNNSTELNQRFGMRRDYTNRLYTVLNIPQETIEEPYNLRKGDIDKIAETFIKDYSNEVSKFLDTKGLSELYGFYEIKKVDKYSYLLVFGFSLLNSVKLFKNTYFRLVPTLVVITSIILLISYLK